jgi:hypothetical protein
MVGQVIRQAYISRADLQANPQSIFLFGDNMQKTGLAGQAAAMRGEPNACGVPTKWRPSRHPTAYFTDASFAVPEVRFCIDEAFNRAEYWLARDCDVVIPADGLGTGLADLPTRAPKIHAYIESRIQALCNLALAAAPAPSGPQR